MRAPEIIYAVGYPGYRSIHLTNFVINALLSLGFPHFLVLFNLPVKNAALITRLINIYMRIRNMISLIFTLLSTLFNSTLFFTLISMWLLT